MVLALTTLQEVGIVVGIVGVIGTLTFAAVNSWLAVSNERKRTQPIVMAHQEGQRRFVERSRCFAVDTYLTNKGSGAGFNVRFGVALNGVRFPYKHEPDDHDAGSVHRVIGAGERLPPEHGTLPIEFDGRLLLGTQGDPDPTRVFWARYENAQGRLWETRNPGDRSKQLDIRRVHARRLHEWREQRRREKVLSRGAAKEKQAEAELREQGPLDTPPPS